MKKICWFVNITDGYKDFIGIFDDCKDEEMVANAINKEIENMGFLYSYEDPDGVLGIGRSLAHNNYAQYGNYEFAIENIMELEL